MKTKERLQTTLDRLPYGPEGMPEDQKVSKKLPEGVRSRELYEDIVRIAGPSFVELLLTPVSYTHLDVYKRQGHETAKGRKARHLPGISTGEQKQPVYSEGGIEKGLVILRKVCYNGNSVKRGIANGVKARYL